MSAETPVLDPAAAYALWAASYPPEAHNPLMRAEERAMLSLLPNDLRGCTILDAGCGSGRYLRHAQQRGAGRLVGMDLSPKMLARAQTALAAERETPSHASSRSLLQARLPALPLRDAWADVTLCGLTLGHLEDLESSLAELRRVTRPGGLLLCSDFHPVCRALGWRRTFEAEGRPYAVTHTAHLYSDWRRACRRLHLRIVSVLEPFLDPADVPKTHRDPMALRVPVALVYALRRQGPEEITELRLA
jgi:malonyl-CoA O-methyltransferase